MSDWHLRWCMSRLMRRKRSACLFGGHERRFTARWYEFEEGRTDAELELGSVFDVVLLCVPG